MKRMSFIIALVMILTASLVAFAQQPTVGNLSGRVVDADGKPLPGATVTISGPLGDKAIQTDTEGRFEYRMIPPGTYRVKIDMEGFNPVAFTKVGVSAGQTTPLAIKMSAGKTEEVTVTSAQPLVDVKRVEVQTTFKTDQAINTLPIGRNFVAAVAFAPGVVAATGTGNYSISGSSGLENSYVIDGVNITSSGYGGVGTYSQVYGSLGTSITSDFLEEVQVKTAGFEAEYGQALGGVITGVVKSGTNDLKGRVALYYSPRSMEAYGKDVQLIGGAANRHDHQIADVGIQAGGPIFKDRLFWFAAYNPTKNWNDLYNSTDNAVNPLWDPNTGDALAHSTYLGQYISPASLTSIRGDRKADNYAAKLNAVLSLNHRLEATFFGDPSEGYGGQGSLTSDPMVLIGGAEPYTPASFGTGGQKSTIKWGADQQSLKYNGFFGGEWFLEAQFSHRKNKFEETLTPNEYAYTDYRIQNLTGVGQLSRGGGVGFYAPITDETKDYSIKLTKTLGSHELKAGYEYWDLKYGEAARYSGVPFTVNFPSFPTVDTNEDGTIDAKDAAGFVPVQTTTGANVQVLKGFGPGGCDPNLPIYDYSAQNACLANPTYRVTRTRFNDPGITTANEQNFFVQDTWSVTDKWTVKLGVRSAHQKLEGSSPFTLPFAKDPDPAHKGFYVVGETAYNPNQYTFKMEWSPRIGVSFDPAANGKTKLFANYARYFERVPSDLAVRQFSNEVGASVYQTTDPLLQNRAGSGALKLQGVSPGTVQDGTRLPYKDEYVVGFQQLLRPDLSLEVRGIYRKQGRVLEDTQNTTVEQIENLYYGASYGLPDPFPGQGYGEFGAYVLSNPGENTGAGFGTPDLKYKALEIQLEKRLSNNWSAFANYRFSSLKGNYEGLFRTDNTQSDPNITSLFDFPNSHIMRGQFQSGVLANDRPNVLHLGGNYFFNNGVELGMIFNWQSGTPRTSLLAHPNYQNAGELPGRDPIYTYWVPNNIADPTGPGQWARAKDCTGNPGNLLPTGTLPPCFLYDYTDTGRGANGRTPDITTIDLHAGWGKDFKGMRVKVAFDITNLFNNTDAATFNDDIERTAAVADPNYLRVTGYQLPRAVRFSVLWDW